MNSNYVCLDSIGHFIRGAGITKADLVDKGGLPCIRYAELYTEYGEGIHEPVSNVSDKGARGALKLQFGDILFPTSGETVEDIGKAVAFVGDSETFAGGDILVLRSHGQNPMYLAHALNTWEATRQKWRLAKGNSIVHIHAPELSKIDVWLPPLIEQDKIVQILTYCDEIIYNLANLIILLQNETVALLKKLFSKKSSPFQLLDSILSDIATISKGHQVNRTELTEIGAYPVYNGGINPSGYYGKYNLPADTLTISEGGNSCGHIKFIKERFWSGGHRYSVHPISKELNPRLLYFALKAHQNKIMRLRVGSGLPNIQRSSLERFKFYLPAASDAELVLSICTESESGVENLERQFMLYKQLKHGLMQQLLTGKLRV